MLAFLFKRKMTFFLLFPLALVFLSFVTHYTPLGMQIAFSNTTSSFLTYMLLGHLLS
jgi:hypothetical protein